MLILLLTTSLAAVAFSSTVPEQLHLSLAGSDPVDGSPTGMKIGWYTNDRPSTLSTVEFGTSPTQLSTSSVSTVNQYLAGHGWHHVALMNCTAPSGGSSLIGNDVYYRVGSGNNNTTWSKVYTFSTSKWKSGTTTTVSMFGDLGYEDSAHRKATIMEVEPEQFESPISSTTSLRRRQLRPNGLTKEWSATFTREYIEHLKNRDVLDMVFHAGDIGYADDSFLIDPLHFTYEEVYNGYMNWFQNVTAIMPYMVSPGNHESECHSPACVVHHTEYGIPLSNFTAFNARWHMPSAESGGHARSNMWYSFNFGDVHYVSINSETDFVGAEESTTGDSHMKNLPAGGFGYKGEYMKWLENDLATAHGLRLAVAAAVVGEDEGGAGGGEGGGGGGGGGGAAGGRARPWIVAVGHRPYGDVVEAAKLFEKYQVDVYVAGHKHSYARSNGGTYGNDTVYVVAGGAGCDEMKQGAAPHADDFAGNIAPSSHQVAVTSERYSSGVMTTNATHLKWELLDSVTGVVLDMFELNR